MTIIVSQDFNALGAAAPSNPTSNSDTLSSGGTLTNFGASNSTPAWGLEYQTLWFATRAGVTEGPRTAAIDGDSGDFIGANSFAGVGAPNTSPGGIPYQSFVEYNYEFNDGDGRLELRFAPVDVSDYINREISLGYWINEATYESDDSFVVTVSDGTTSQDVLAFGETELETNVAADITPAVWKTLTVDLDDLIADGFNAESIQLSVKVDTNSSDENVFIDDVQFTGDAEPQPVAVVINEIDADQTGTDSQEFIELYDGGAGNTSLDGLVLVLYNGNGDVVYGAYDLDGYSTNESGYFVLGSAGVANVDWAAFTTDGLQNGADAVALYQGSAADFAAGTPLTTVNLLDAIVYDTSDADDTGLLPLLNAGQPQVDENANGAGTTQSLQRIPNGDGGERNTDTYVAALPTPGAANSDILPPVAKEIWEVQDSGSASPLVGTTVVIDAIVTGDFQNGDGDTTRNLGGFYLQELVGDGDLATSDGVFVYEPGANFLTDVNAGDHVQVTGTVQEYFGETQVVATAITIIEAGAVDDPSSLAVTLDLPSTGTVTSADGKPIADLEFVEGMLVTVPEALTVTELFNLDRFGEMRASADGRLFQYTNENDPSIPGYAANLQELAARTVMIDDGQTVQNPDPIVFPSPELTTANPVRMGDTVSDLTGNVRFSRGSGGSGDEIYRIQPTETPTFVANTERPDEPGDLGEAATLSVASFNVLNYFTTLGSRGAETGEEFTRQTEKLVSAITSLDADILGLIELEDNGFGPDSAIATLVGAVNDALGGTVYGFVDPGLPEVDDDEITVGFIYRLDTVQIADGTSVEILTDSDFPALGLSYGQSVFTGSNTSRAPMAVTFEEIRGGETLTVAVNHFKSKSGTGSGDDADILDGQGSFNGTRERSADALAHWLATDPTGSGDSDVLIIGDLNAYLKEDPVTLLGGAGYDVLTEVFGIDNPYSYVFDGQAGALDHALSSANLTDQVTGISEWHINADEADALDYNLNFDRNPAIFDGSVPFRASDHDPAVVGLNLKGALNLIVGSDGNDNLPGTAADDEIRGLAGNDTIRGGDGGDLLIGGAGNDLIAADLVGSFADLGGVEEESELFGGGGDDTLIGGDRDDYIVGGEDNDLLRGNAGNDTLDGGAGDDRNVGNAGDDLYLIRDAGDHITEFKDEGTDTVIASVDYTLDAQVEVLTLTGSALAGTGNGRANLITGTVANNVLSGLDNNDTLVGGDGADTLLGGNGVDSLSGGDGDDNLDGGYAGDRMAGGDGDDIYVVDTAADVTIEAAGEGVDTVISSISRGLGANLENLTLTGTAAINGTGNSLANVMIGDAGDNSLAAGGDADTLDGGAGNDTLFGSVGDDLLTGGTGADVFRFTGKNSNIDTVTDFTSGEDRIDLSVYGLTFAQLDISTSGGNLLIDLNADIPGAGVIVLLGVDNVSGSDFLFN